MRVIKEADGYFLQFVGCAINRVRAENLMEDCMTHLTRFPRPESCLYLSYSCVDFSTNVTSAGHGREKHVKDFRCE